ncbi:MAG: hypothetical protein AMXMBFR23_02410 [Chloroflexota bacterium]
MLAGEAALSTLTDSPSVQSGRGPECDGVLRLFGNSHPAFSAFSVADVDGEVTCSGQADLVGLSVADRSYFHSALRAGEIVSSGFLVSRPSRIPIIVLAAPLGDASGDVINGVLILSLELDWVSDVLGRLDLPPGSTLTVTGASGDEIIRLGGEDAAETATVGAQQPLRRTAASGGLDGFVSVLIPRGEVIAAATTRMWRNLLVLVGAAGTFGVISFALVTTTVQHPLDRLVEFTRRLAAGDFGVRTETRAIDAPEVVHLAEAMNISAESLGEQERRLVEMATVDSLTGLPNRIGFVQLAAAHLADASRQGETAIVGVVGLRAFTAINATLGFDVGDEVLRAVGARIKATLPDDAVVARLSGDSFVFSLLGADADGERSVAELLHDVLASPLPVGGTLLRVRSYVGLSVFPKHGDDLELLSRRAEVASRRARDEAQHWAQFDAQRDEPDHGQLQLLADLQGAIERSALEVHYQPKVHLPSGRLSGAEALVRWRNHGEYVSPAHFIPLAEQAGMIPDITRAVLHAVVAQLDEWHAVGISVPVSVNISVLDLDDDRFTDALAELLQESSIPAHLLELEITETALLRDVETARAAAGRLQAMGVSLSIDDFGVGFAPLTYLTTFPLHAIKLDRAFVADLASNPRSQTIVASTIGLAHGLGLEVVAEGVETTEVAAVLRRLGCDHVQGYAFARPGPADELAAYAEGPTPVSWRPPAETG